MSDFGIWNQYAPQADRYSLLSYPSPLFSFYSCFLLILLLNLSRIFIRIYSLKKYSKKALPYHPSFNLHGFFDDDISLTKKLEQVPSRYKDASGRMNRLFIGDEDDDVTMRLDG